MGLGGGPGGINGGPGGINGGPGGITDRPAMTGGGTPGRPGGGGGGGCTMLGMTVFANMAMRLGCRAGGGTMALLAVLGGAALCDETTSWGVAARRATEEGNETPGGIGTEEGVLIPGGGATADGAAAATAIPGGGRGAESPGGGGGGARTAAALMPGGAAMPGAVGNTDTEYSPSALLNMSTANQMRNTHKHTNTCSMHARGAGLTEAATATLAFFA